MVGKAPALEPRLSLKLKSVPEVPAAKAPTTAPTPAAPGLADLVTAKDVLMDLPPRLPDEEVAKLECAPGCCRTHGLQLSGQVCAPPHHQSCIDP